MTRTGTQATDEQRAASSYLGSLGDSLAPWVRSTGPIDAYATYTPVEVHSPLEWFSYSVISRQLSRAAAVAIYSRLVAHFGGSITAERVVATDERTLRGLGLSVPKARAIRGLADEGLLDLDNLDAMPDSEILPELMAVPGIGASSSKRFLMQYLHRPDVFPSHDLTVRAAITALDKLDHTITPKSAEERSELWRPYRSYATSYLSGYLWEVHPPATVQSRAAGVLRSNVAARQPVDRRS